MANSYDEIMEVLSRTVAINYDTSKNIEFLRNRMEQSEKLLGGLSNKVTDIEQDVSGLNDKVFQLEQNEEITTAQSGTIRKCAQKRIIDILGDDPYERQKYFKTFIQRLYGDTRKHAGLGSQIDRTKKCDFQRCLDYIESWNPSCGSTELRAQADANAEARLKARENGYLPENTKSKKRKVKDITKETEVTK